MALSSACASAQSRLISCCSHTMLNLQDELWRGGPPLSGPLWCLFSVGNLIIICSFSVTIAYYYILSLLLKVLFRVCRNYSKFRDIHTEENLDFSITSLSKDYIILISFILLMYLCFLICKYV